MNKMKEETKRLDIIMAEHLNISEERREKITKILAEEAVNGSDEVDELMADSLKYVHDREDMSSEEKIFLTFMSGVKFVEIVTGVSLGGLYRMARMFENATEYLEEN